MGESLQDTSGPLRVSLSIKLLDAREGKVIWASIGQHKGGRFFGNYSYLEAIRFLVKKALESLPSFPK